MVEEYIVLKIIRQDNPKAPSHWEIFKVPYQPDMNVITCLMEIQKNPVTAEGKATTPVTWECNCLEEVCGACSMIINGKPQQACSSLVDTLSQPIILKPLSKFPLIRDLVVDRSRMFENLKKVKAWVPIDGAYNIGAGPRWAEEERVEAYILQRCMTCGCCLEACPQYELDKAFIGASAISYARYMNIHPIGKLHSTMRLDVLAGEGGLADCGNSQNCVEVCPKEIPLTTSIADMQRQATKFIFKKLLGV